MTREDQYRQATAEVERAKAAFLSSAEATKSRVAPARLMHDAKEKAGDTLVDGRERIVEGVKEHPVATAAAGGALLLYLFRRPLTALFRGAYVRVTNRPQEILETDDG